MSEEEKGKIVEGAEKTGKVVGEGVKKGFGAVKGFGKGIGKGVANKTDMTCDKCGKAMKPGGNVKKNIAGEDHQFCSEACATAWKPGDKEK